MEQSTKQFIKPEELPRLREEFQSVINTRKPDPLWKFAYAKFAKKWNDTHGKTLGYLPGHTQNNSSGVFNVYSDNLRENTKQEVERIFGGIILRVGTKDAPPDELGDNISLLPETVIWDHTDTPEAENSQAQPPKENIELTVEEIIYSQFGELFLACDDIINPEKLLPSKEELIINLTTGSIKHTRSYIERLPPKQKDAIIDFIVGFYYKK